MFEDLQFEPSVLSASMEDSHYEQAQARHEPQAESMARFARGLR
jgi:hypothetical protein